MALRPSAPKADVSASSTIPAIRDIFYYSKGFLARGAGALYLESKRSSFSSPSGAVIVLVK